MVRVWARRVVTPDDKQDWREGAADHNRCLLESMRPGQNDDVILVKSEADTKKHFATAPMDYPSLLKYLGGVPFRLIRRFVIIQASGKARVIDDAAAGGQSDKSTDENILSFCSAIQPATHIALLMDGMKHQGGVWPPGEGISTAGEDLPDAYRYTPMNPAEARGCVVVWWHPGWGKPAFQVYHGLLFGLPLAVTSFNRWPKMLEAIMRRLLVCLFSMYFDDGTNQDWSSTAVVTQLAVSKVMVILGSPWAQEKSQKASQEADFLGLVHNLTNVHKGTITS